MTHAGRCIGSVLVLVTSLACSKEAATPAPDTQADVGAIVAVREREAALLATGNMDSLLQQVYSEDVTFHPPNEPAVHGRDAAKTWGDAMFAQFTMTARYTGSETAVSGDMAVDPYTATLTITPKAGGAPMEEQIKGIHVLRRQADGTWRIVYDGWNTNAPAPPPPPAATKR